MYHPIIFHLCNVKEVSHLIIFHLCNVKEVAPSKWLIYKVLISLLFYFWSWLHNRAKLHDEEPCVNVFTRSGTTTSEDKGKKLDNEILIRKSHKKKEELNLQCEKDTFVEVKKGFAEASTSTSSRTMDVARVDEEIKPFLQACIKLLHNKKAVENLQALIDNCAEKEQP